MNVTLFRQKAECQHFGQRTYLFDSLLTCSIKQ